eukprot:TRINITY_DN63128_c0_g1_i1.p1 TRINITY_DN63128_c0_g1~~TRINITY_DN63128_c0_g1_i1.p1  ORF type:complete len:475 (-),score=68.43 TRINITY_DN63128_c0_g1_i1:101-1525(-)
MGGIQDTPITTKESGWGPPSGRLGLSWASSCMQGWRAGMEDAHICLPALGEEGHWRDVAMFGVMDGHGGEQVARFAERHIPKELVACPLNGSLSNKDLKAGLVNAFHRIDELLRVKGSLYELKELTNVKKGGRAGYPGFATRETDFPNPDMVGCTSCICCITPTHILVANAGDSRAVLCRGGAAYALSEDHKPNSPVESRRITAAGGFVETQNIGPGQVQYRVNGNLNLSRALGDLEYKKDRSRGPEEQIISATPDVEIYERTPEDEFLIVCCDGVWDVKTNQEVVDFVRRKLPSKNGDADANARKMSRIMEDLLDACISPDLRRTKGLGGDNMTAVVVRLTPPGIAEVSPAPASSPPSTSPTRCDLLGAKAQWKSKDRGELVVRLALSNAGARDPATVDLLVHSQSAKLEVALMPRYGDRNEAFTVEVDLSKHLPADAEICHGDGHDEGLGAIMSRNASRLCARLPIRRRRRA